MYTEEMLRSIIKESVEESLEEGFNRKHKLILNKNKPGQNSLMSGINTEVADDPNMTEGDSEPRLRNDEPEAAINVENAWESLLL